MIKSMTGYGKAECTLSDCNKITVEIKTLNGKSSDINIKGGIIPKEKELEVRKYLATELVRGSIDFLAIKCASQNPDTLKNLNIPVIQQYFNQLSLIVTMTSDSRCAGVVDKTANAILLNAILRLPDAIQTSQAEELTEEDWCAIQKAIEKAVENLNNYRTAEGEALYKDVTHRVSLILEYLDKIKQIDIERVPAIKERLKAKITEAGVETDPNRLEQEMVFYIEKLDITEEKVRLGQHCAYFMQTIDNEALAGKKLGFIVQEMGREINTLGSKANDAEIQKIVVKMKDELEKIREQSLNIL